MSHKNTKKIITKILLLLVYIKECGEFDLIPIGKILLKNISVRVIRLNHSEALGSLSMILLKQPIRLTYGFKNLLPFNILAATFIGHFKLQLLKEKTVLWWEHFF